MQIDVREGYTLPPADHLLLSLSTPASFLPLKAPEHRGYSFEPLFHQPETVTASFFCSADRLWPEKGRCNKPSDLQPGFYSFFLQSKSIISQKLQASCAANVASLPSDKLSVWKKSWCWKTVLAEGIWCFVLREPQWLLLLYGPSEQLLRRSVKSPPHRTDAANTAFDPPHKLWQRLSYQRFLLPVAKTQSNYKYSQCCRIW